MRVRAARARRNLESGHRHRVRRREATHNILIVSAITEAKRHRKFDGSWSSAGVMRRGLCRSQENYRRRGSWRDSLRS